MITQTGPDFSQGVGTIVFWLVVVVLAAVFWLIVNGGEIR